MNQKKEKKFRKAVRMEAKIFYNELLRKKPKWIPLFIFKWLIDKVLNV